jgi:hypothetical protein
LDLLDPSNDPEFFWQVISGPPCILCPEGDWQILNCIYVNQSLAGQTLAELTDQHSKKSKKKKREVEYHIIYN